MGICVVFLYFQKKINLRMIDIAISIPSITSITNVRYSKKVVSSLQGWNDGWSFISF